MIMGARVARMIVLGRGLPAGEMVRLMMVSSAYGTVMAAIMHALSVIMRRVGRKRATGQHGAVTAAERHQHGHVHGHETRECRAADKHRVLSQPHLRAVSTDSIFPSARRITGLRENPVQGGIAGGRVLRDPPDLRVPGPSSRRSAVARLLPDKGCMPAPSKPALPETEGDSSPRAAVTRGSP